MRELVEQVTKIRLRPSQGQPTLKKTPKLRQSSIIMAADYGHVFKNFDPVFVGTYYTIIVLTLCSCAVTSILEKKISLTHFISLIHFKYGKVFRPFFCVGESNLSILQLKWLERISRCVWKKLQDSYNLYLRDFSLAYAFLNI